MKSNLKKLCGCLLCAVAALWIAQRSCNALDSLQQASDFPQPDLSRLPVKPAWEVDLTDSLNRQMPDGTLVPYNLAMGRAARENAKAPTWDRWTWKTQIRVPDDKLPLNWPVVLELDESRVVASIQLDGKPLGAFDRSMYGQQHQDGEGFLLLPLNAEHPAGELTIVVLPMSQIYSNGFGRLRLRPATVSEAVTIEVPKDGGVNAVNRSNVPIPLQLHSRHEDYFGAQLGSVDSEVNLLPPGASVHFDLKCPGSESLYKTRVWATAQNRSGLHHWMVWRGSLQNHYRGETRYLDDGWEYVMADPKSPLPSPVQATGDDVPAPDQGWKPINPAEDDVWKVGERYTAHVMWYRRKIVIPAGWTGRRFQLFLSHVSHHATVFLDGAEIARRASWQLPDYLNLPESVQPGSEHVLLIRVMDYTVALAPWVNEIPPPGAHPPLPAGAIAAPIACASNPQPAVIGMYTAPELLAVPQIRTDFVPIVTTLKDGQPGLQANAEIYNGSTSTADIKLVATLLQKGVVVATAATDGVNVAAASTSTLALPHLECSAVQLWDLEHPNLYELRVELFDRRTNQKLDSRRERFGFRVFSTQEGYFTLNGHRVNLYGGSHMVLSGRLWPLLPPDYRILRYMFQSSSGQGGGPMNVGLADEIGALVKLEHPDHNSLNQDNYAYGLDIFWDRLWQQMQQNWRVNSNTPSVVIWDMGNELSPGSHVDRFVQIFHRMRELDPTRLVTVGGAAPHIPDNDLVDLHGYGTYERREEYYFQHPEERPDYNKDSGYFQHRPLNEPSDRWKIVDGPDMPTMGFPADGRGTDLGQQLVALPAKPVLFSEGHYYENMVNPDLCGMDVFLAPPCPLSVGEKSWAKGTHLLNILAQRLVSVQNVRQAEVAGSMIHVDRGVGRNLEPLTAFSFDRRYRFESGTPLESTWTVHDELAGKRAIDARWTLYDGATILASQYFHQSMEGAQIAKVPLRMELPRVDQNRDLRLHVEVTAEGYSGAFRDDANITVFSPVTLRVPDGETLLVFDPESAITPTLDKDAVRYSRIENLHDFSPSQHRSLLIAEEALHHADGHDLAWLGKKVSEGGRVIILQHKSLPRFLSISAGQYPMAKEFCQMPDTLSPLTKGLVRQDFQFWTDRQGDQLVYWNGFGVPSSCNARPHLLADDDRTCPLLEIREGNGCVIQCQLNIESALGLDPAARRVLANLLEWTALPSSFAEGSNIVTASDPALISNLSTQVGLRSDLENADAKDRFQNARFIFVDGKDEASRKQLTSERDDVIRSLETGATLYVSGLDAAGTTWLSDLIGSKLELKSIGKRYKAWLCTYDPVTRGLTHSPFYWAGDVLNGVPNVLEGKAICDSILTGPDVIKLTEPAMLTRINRGKGRVVVDLSALTMYPVRRNMQVLSILFSNCGATLHAGQPTISNRSDWAFSPVDLSKFVNWPLVDNPAGHRGWHGGGPDNDLREFPRGPQKWNGIEYNLVNPDATGGNGCIALSATRDKGVLPAEVKGIAVHQRADKLFFLHTSAWGVPQFTYRVYYTQRRKEWIPGKPDPFVDVIVKPGENIDDWFNAGKVLSGDEFLSGAIVAWSAQTKASRATGATVGVYQMVWSNPNPSEEIESIDVLSPGTVGTGEVFVLAITAGQRK